MACSAFAQPDAAAQQRPAPLFHFGIFGGIGPTLQRTDLTIPGYGPDCARLLRGSGTGWWAGLLGELEVQPWLAVQLRLGADVHNGALSARYSGDPIGRQDGQIVTATVDQVVEYDALDSWNALLARAPLIGRVNALAGVSLGRGVSSVETHKQVAIEPEELLLSNNRRELVLQSGRLYNRSVLLAGLVVGASFDLPIGHASALSPEILATIPLNNRTPDGSWRSFSLRAGASLRFGIPRADTARPLPPLPQDTAPQKRPPTLVTDVVTEPRVVGVRIDERDSAEVLPLLNQIFFAETSAELRREYARLTPSETGGFSNANLIGSALDVYYQLLNIVGRRMRETPAATLVINGYRNGREQEPGLSAARAETIKRYLADVWKIAPSRLKTRGAALPPNPARESSAEGYEENSRVEIVPSDPNILAPILRRHVQRTATPPAITFYPRALAEAGVDRWQLETEERGKGIWRTFTGYGKLPDSIVWDWRSDRGELPSLPMQLGYRFTVMDSAGHSTTTDIADIEVDYQSVSSKLEHRENDTTIESYSILLFNFDSPKVSASDAELLQAISDAVRSGAHVRLVGYTDSLGEESHNRELATERAREVARLLGRMLPRDVELRVDEENGGEYERFGFGTPEGRSHCRTVIIDVRTPTRGSP